MASNAIRVEIPSAASVPERVIPLLSAPPPGGRELTVSEPAGRSLSPAAKFWPARTGAQTGGPCHLYYKVVGELPRRHRRHSTHCPSCGGDGNPSTRDPFGRKLDYVWGRKLGRPNLVERIRSQVGHQFKHVLEAQRPWEGLGVSRRTYYRAVKGR